MERWVVGGGMMFLLSVVTGEKITNKEAMKGLTWAVIFREEQGYSL